MPNLLGHPGGGFRKPDKSIFLRWAHFCAPILAIAFFFSPVNTSSPTHAQTLPGLPLFENVTLTPGFAPDPVVLRGVSGGSTSASIVADRKETTNGPCVGFVDEQPDHRIVLTSFFSYLSIQVQSDRDTTLAIRGPGGSWCNDDEQGKNPGISGQWLQGTYEIWVGSYEPEKYYPYRIEITAFPE